MSQAKRSQVVPSRSRTTQSHRARSAMVLRSMLSKKQKIKESDAQAIYPVYVTNYKWIRKNFKEKTAEHGA